MRLRGAACSPSWFMLGLMQSERQSMNSAVLAYSIRQACDGSSVRAVGGRDGAAHRRRERVAGTRERSR